MSARTTTNPRERIYDRWSCHPRALDILYTVAFLGREDELRRRAIQRLELSAGERVLEIGCGTGNSFGAIRRAIGPNGTAIGLDASQGMIRAASDRIQEMEWQNVHVCLADARRPPLPDGTCDAAYAAMSLSAVADPERAIEAVRATLRPGGRFVVLDAQPFQESPWTLVNPLITPLAEHTTNWVPEVDLVAALRHEFDAVDITAFNAGSIVIVRAET